MVLVACGWGLGGKDKEDKSFIYKPFMVTRARKSAVWVRWFVRNMYIPYRFRTVDNLGTKSSNRFQYTFCV